MVETRLEVLQDQNRDLVEDARRYYDTGMEYHNFEGHALGVWVEARKLADFCMRNGKLVDLTVIDYAALYHDANVHRPLVARYKTYERWSGAIAARSARNAGHSAEVSEHVRRSVIATEYGSKPTSIEAAVVKRADIANVGSGYVEFVSNSLNIFRETVRRKGILATPDSFEVWKNTSCSFLLGLLREDEPFGDFDLAPTVEHPASPFKLRGLLNITELTAETLESITSKVSGAVLRDKKS